MSFWPAPGPCWIHGTATVIVSRVTPCQVAPPLSLPPQNATQGGDCGSSVCRGGSPTHRRTRAPGGSARLGTAGGLTDARGDADGRAAVRSPTSPPSPEPKSLVCSFGASLICSRGCGANSAMAGGDGLAGVSARTDRIANMATADAAYTVPGPLPARRPCPSATVVLPGQIVM